MKKSNIFLIYPLFIGVFLVITTGCSKEEDINATNGKTTAVFNPNVSYGTLTDQDGNIYKTITIGTQTWMAENLRTTRYKDGTSIPNVTGNDEWMNLTTGAYCSFNNTTDIVTIATYGLLYHWYAVNTGKLAPTGWHVATDAEWTTLITYLGGESIAGGKLKETGTIHWNSPNEGAINESGFTALPGGYRTGDGIFYEKGNYGSWWFSTEYSSSDAFGIDLFYNYSYVSVYVIEKKCGFSVRCIKD